MPTTGQGALGRPLQEETLELRAKGEEGWPWGDQEEEHPKQRQVQRSCGRSEFGLWRGRKEASVAMRYGRGQGPDHS